MILDTATTMIHNQEGSYIWTWTQIEAQPDPQHGVPIPRSSHGVSYLAHCDTLIVYGGEHVARTPMEDESASCWICRNVTTTAAAAWKRIDCSTSSTSPPSRIAHAQALYDDRYLYIFGGRAGITMQERAMNDLWVLDTADFTWSQVIVNSNDAYLPEARSFHRMICIGSNLYVFGGCGAHHGRLNDLYTFDIATKTWHCLGVSHHLRGRGGPNLLSLQSGRQLAVVAGFAGEETADGHVYTMAVRRHNDDHDENANNGAWETDALTPLLQGMRPRSVCVSASFPTLGLAIVFGGEVDPSDKGHEGAGAFENDIVVLDERTGAYLSTRKAAADEMSWPEQRGWSDAASTETPSDGGGTGHLFLFGGLAGDDTNPQRLNDLWRLDIQKSK
jgi:Galactose oxidase, central domain